MRNVINPDPSPDHWPMSGLTTHWATDNSYGSMTQKLWRSTNEKGNKIVLGFPISLMHHNSLSAVKRSLPPETISDQKILHLVEPTFDGISLSAGRLICALMKAFNGVHQGPPHSTRGVYQSQKPSSQASKMRWLKTLLYTHNSSIHTRELGMLFA